MLQALLSGWVLLVGTGGILFEGLILLHARRRWTGGLAVAAVAVGLYVFSAVQLGRLFFARPPTPAPMFHAVVILIAGWSACQWWRLARRSRAACRTDTRQAQLPPPRQLPPIAHRH